MGFDLSAFDETLANARRALLDARTSAGHWEGELSSSALSTATAVFALHLLLGAAEHFEAQSHQRILDPQTETACQRLITDGLGWLALHQNRDGGWGDTTLSLSNISTTALCWAALSADRPGPTAAYTHVTDAAEHWLARQAGGTDPDHLIPAIIARYGKDHTFSVPILTMCALAGRLGKGRDAWRSIPQLPFELAAFPQRWFKWLRLPVVSYALPALIAIGQARHHQRPSRNPLARGIRKLVSRRTLRLLERIQPSSGGFLEATPLTSFVLMSLVGAGLADHPVVARGMDFLIRSARSDGSWPIDTNLATWVTTLSVNALALDPHFHERVPEQERSAISNWLLGQQYRVEDPYTLADAGGWAWTDLSGGVPDADDTPGALLALRHLGPSDDRTREAAAAGVSWLLGLQNADGGIPTFCRGWGKLPFDRSSEDLTAHTLRAWSAWEPEMPQALQETLQRARQRAFAYLMRTQRPDGSWVPLWFGNQHMPDDENPTYGTARVLLIGADTEALISWQSAAGRGLNWLLTAQNEDGGWGGGKGTPSSIEETALAIEALCMADDYVLPVLHRGIAWLIAHTDRGRQFAPSPIGFYFAKLWYYETLYPLIFTLAALHAARKRIPRSAEEDAEDAPGSAAKLGSGGDFRAE